MSAKYFECTFLMVVILAVVGAVPVAKNELARTSSLPVMQFDQVVDDSTLEQEDFEVLQAEELQNVEHGARFRRATCDLFSVELPWGKVNHAACAAHCLSMRKGYRGGYCRRAICHCRR